MRGMIRARTALTTAEVRPFRNHPLLRGRGAPSRAAATTTTTTLGNAPLHTPLQEQAPAGGLKPRVALHPAAGTLQHSPINILL